MKNLKLLSFALWILLARTIYGQGYGGPLSFQGLDRQVQHSAAARAMGGVAIGQRSDPGVMFQHPASLYSIEKLQFAFGVLMQSQKLMQEQHYAPVRYYPNLSLLLEGLTARIPDPDTSLFGFTAKDTVQRPFDDIGPNWSRSKDRRTPVQAMLATPLSIGNVKVVVGLGAVRYADLNHFYQNNNVLSPAILSQRPLPTLRPTDDNPLVVDWLQSLRSRSGWIQGYGFAIASGVEKYHMTFGLSGMVLKGTTDDLEQQVARGKLTFFSNAFRIDSVFSRTTKIGTSEFSGHEFTFSSVLLGRYVSIGFFIKPASTITRNYNFRITGLSQAGQDSASSQGQDHLKLPWRTTIGLVLTPRGNVTLGLEYEVRPYKSLRYISADGNETSPWRPAPVFRLGAEYRMTPWLALRAGMRGEAEVFEPEGNQIPGEPVRYDVYTAGLGLFFSDFRLDLAYENALTKYQDIWSSAISKNSERRQMVVLQLSYELPWID